jgi:hypothetical protein
MKKLFIASLMLGLMLIPSTSWSMEVQERLWLPDDVLFHCFSFLPPVDRTNVERVCNQWYAVSSDINLWQQNTGKHSWTQDSEKAQAMLNAFEILATKFPDAVPDWHRELLSIPFPPTVQSYKNYYAALYLDELSQCQESPEKSKELLIKSNAYFHRACDEGNPRAIRHSTQIFQAANRIKSKHYYGSIEPGLIDACENILAMKQLACTNCETCRGTDRFTVKWGNKEETREESFNLLSALYGSSQNSAGFMYAIFLRLSQFYWQETEPSQEHIETLVKFGNIWPKGREMLFLFGYGKHIYIEPFQLWVEKEFHNLQKEAWDDFDLEPVWNEDLTSSYLENTYQDLPNLESYRESYQSYYMDKLQEEVTSRDKFFSLWQRLRYPDTHFLYHYKKNYSFAFPYLINSGQGEIPVNFGGYSTFLKWPEALRLLGRCHVFHSWAHEEGSDESREALEKAKTYFSQAMRDGDIKSHLLLGNILEKDSKNKESLQKIQEHYPTSVTVLSKLGKILIDEIPDDVEETHPCIQTFVGFFKKSCDRMYEKYAHLPSGVLRARYNKARGYDEFIEILSQYLIDARPTKKLKSTELCFLDEVLQGPYGSHDVNQWNQTTRNLEDITTTYMNEKWGNFLETGKLPAGSDKEQWSERDTRYTIEYMSINFSFRNRTPVLARKCYAFLMDVCLEQKKEDFFIDAYFGYSKAQDKDGLKITHYKLLETKSRQFKQAFPHNNEVEELFQTLPVPEAKQKRTHMTQGKGRPTKRHKGDEWDGQ